jgi:hypothetical protein
MRALREDIRCVLIRTMYHLLGVLLDHKDQTYVYVFRVMSKKMIQSN